jgi:cytosine/adenosine deaminase-related metal-dependent hydrolase
MAYMKTIGMLLQLLVVASNVVSIHAATLFTGGTVIAWSNATESLSILRNGSILVEDSTVTAIYSGAPTSSLPSDVEIVNTTNDIISTGFIDTHRHSWQTAFKTLGSNTTLLEYFQRYGPSSPAQGIFTPEDVYLSQLLGYYEALNGGVTTVVDYASHTWSAEHAAAGLKGMIESGTRGVFAYQLAEYGNFTWNDTVRTFKSMATDDTISSPRLQLGLAYDAFSGTTAQAERRSRDVIQLARSVRPIPHHLDAPSDPPPATTASHY